MARRAGRFLMGAVGLGGGGPPAAGSGRAAVERPFPIGRENHTLTVVPTGARAEIRMSSAVVMEFSQRLARIRDEWLPLRREHPAGDLRRELDGLADEGTRRLVAINAAGPASQQALTALVDSLAGRLREICRRFDIQRVEGVSDYREAPEHRPTYASPDRWGRAQSASVTLSYRSRPFMRSTNPSAMVPGTQPFGYARGHLVAASLGGSNTDRGNFAPMSPATNTTRGGIVMFETALRGALSRDGFPPWIVRYSVSCQGMGTPGSLGRVVAPLLGPAVGADAAGDALYRRVSFNRALDPEALAEIPGADPATVRANHARILDAILHDFAPRRFGVDVAIDQAPDGEALPASAPFDNHQ